MLITNGRAAVEEFSKKNIREFEVEVKADQVLLGGNLWIPEGAEGIVLFAHGSGSSRHSPRNNFVAGVLREGGLATLLMDLLTAQEEERDRRTGELRFDVRFLAKRLLGATGWVREHPDARNLKVGYFGSSTGAAAALIAASREPAAGAVVSRGGRPDLARDVLAGVKAPTLLIVGGNDSNVLELNRDALDRLDTEKRLEIIPGAGHLFEEHGALEKVADLARDWFRQYLGAGK